MVNLHLFVKNEHSPLCGKSDEDVLCPMKLVPRLTSKATTTTTDGGGGGTTGGLVGQAEARQIL